MTISSHPRTTFPTQTPVHSSANYAKTLHSSISEQIAAPNLTARVRPLRVALSLLFLIALFCGTRQSIAIARPIPSEESNTVPNIVLIVADDLGWGDVGWHQSEIPTPHLDRLAKSGVILENFYVQPVCSPTRAALMTGRYPMRHGLQVGVVRPWAQYGLPLEEQTVAEGLASAGYETAIVGKWHLGHFQREYLPTSRGFRHQYGHYNGAIDYNTHERDGGFDWHKDDAVNRDEGYSTELIGNESVRIVETYAGKKPFFLYVPFNAVHTPLQVPEKYLAPFGHLKGNRKQYAGMLNAMDQAIGKIADAIERTGVKENTLILFSSDNGGPSPGKVTSNGPLRAGKGTVYEGGVRVAAFATWPGTLPAGSICNEPMHAVDLYPTLLRLAKANVSQKLPLDGRDVWNAIAKNEKLADREILINAAPTSGAIRAGDWKLVVNGGRANAGFDGEESGADDGPKKPPATEPDRLELFNLQADPFEKTNLSNSNAKQASELYAKWKAYRDQAVAPKTKPKPATFQSPAVWGDFPKAGRLQVGDRAPTIQALDDAGKLWSSSQFLGKKDLVVYFYPGDLTGGCTKQACSYRDRMQDFQSAGIEVVGVSGDSVENHQKFKKAHNLNFTLLADTKGEIAEALGVPFTKEEKKVNTKVGDESYAIVRELTTKRWTFVIDREGKVIYKNEAVVATDDSQAVLEVLRKRSKP
ncbi:sulfatase-like hydrolase/transferase [Pirellulaceae bacterium SH501]